MKMTGAECVLKILEDYGVNHVFGYPGGAVLPLYDALLTTEKIEHILVRSEQAGAHAAATYGKVTGKVGVCIGTSGPGATNLVTGIANAYMDSIPMIAITGQVLTGLIGTDAFQEADITGITLPVTKHSYLVKKVKELLAIVDEAYHIATSGRKGPVLIDVPRDVFEATVDYDPDRKTVNLKGFKPTVEGHGTQIKKAVKMINNSERPLLWLGGGAISAECEDVVKELVEAYKIPLVTTLMGIGIYDETKPLSLGMIGMHGLPYANYAVSYCDVLISVGTRFGDRATGALNRFAKQAKIIHVDIDPAEIGKNIGPDVPIVGDANYVLKGIAAELEKKDREPWLDKISELVENYKIKKEREGLTPQKVIRVLGDLTRDSAIVTTDVGQHQMFTAQHYKFRNKRSFITSGGLGTMGYGVPAGLGAALAVNKKKQVITITGDGSFQMNMAEMATIGEHDLPVKIVLMNNSTLCMVRQLQKLQCESRYSGIYFTGNPDFKQLAASYPNMTTYRIETEDEIESVLKEALSHNKPALIECIIGNKDMVYPVVPAKKGLDEMIGVEK